VLEYFDASLIGLTATPSKQTFGFFDQNLVMEYDHAQAVADGVNVDFDVYKIATKITKEGSTIDAGLFAGFRDRENAPSCSWTTPSTSCPTSRPSWSRSSPPPGRRSW
jgi:type I restriction enzyme R subunit